MTARELRAWLVGALVGATVAGTLSLSFRPSDLSDTPIEDTEELKHARAALSLMTLRVYLGRAREHQDEANYGLAEDELLMATELSLDANALGLSPAQEDALRQAIQAAARVPPGALPTARTRLRQAIIETDQALSATGM